MELLTDEINGFQNSIKRLEGISKGINEVKVDTSKLEYHLKEHLRHQERVQSQNKITLNDINIKLKRAKLIPKWLLVLILSVLVILSMAIGYLSFQVVQMNKNEKTVAIKEKVELQNQQVGCAPFPILLHAYLPERYKIGTGSMPARTERHVRAWRKV